MSYLTEPLIEACPGQVAETVLLAGDPLRARYIAENFLEEAECYNKKHGMYGYTGKYRGCRVSVQGTGMGVTSASAYSAELAERFGANQLIRIGTCGSNNERINVRDVIIALGASMESNTGAEFGPYDFVPHADYELAKTAYEAAMDSKIPVFVGPVVTGDLLHREPEEELRIAERWARYGMLGAEMEVAALYMTASRKKVRALAILTCSDHAVTKEETSHEEREKTFSGMMKIALDTAWRWDRKKRRNGQ